MKEENKTGSNKIVKNVNENVILPKLEVRGETTSPLENKRD
jgi:hypothetical protein